jgi:hypothetical protein
LYITPIFNNGSLGTALTLGYVLGVTGPTGPAGGGGAAAGVSTYNGNTGDVVTPPFLLFQMGII